MEANQQQVQVEEGSLNPQLLNKENTPQKQKNQTDLFPHHLYVKQSTKLPKPTNSDSVKLLDEESVIRDQPLNTQSDFQKAQSQLRLGKETQFNVPIDDFGSKILTQQGWKAGHGIGKAADQPASAIEYVPRQFRLGLGATPLKPDQLASDADRRKMAVTQQYEATATGKNIKRLDEEIKEKVKLGRGSLVLIISGPHKDMKGKVIALNFENDPKKMSFMGESIQSNQRDVPMDSYLSVQLEASGAIIEVKRKRVQMLTSDNKNQPKNRSRSRSRSQSKERLKNQQKDDKHRKKLKWVIEGIFVRYINKKHDNGRLFGRELIVSQVHDQYNFECQLPKTVNQSIKNTNDRYEVIEGLRERDLETVLPSRKDIEKKYQNRVIVIRGSHTGEQGTVLQIDKKRDRVDIQVDSSIITVSQDDCCLLAEKGH